MYKATVNNKTFEINSDADGFIVNGEPINWDLAKLEDDHFHILYKNKSYRAELVKMNEAGKTVTIKVNNNVYTVSLKDKFDLLLEKMGMSNTASNKINNIKAPMPGLIIDLKVKEGDVVKASDALLILEAMKMENIIKSPADAIVKAVKVKQGDKVEKGQVLIEF